MAGTAPTSFYSNRTRDAGPVMPPPSRTSMPGWASNRSPRSNYPKLHGRGAPHFRSKVCEVLHRRSRRLGTTPHPDQHKSAAGPTTGGTSPVGTPSGTVGARSGVATVVRARSGTSPSAMTRATRSRHAGTWATWWRSGTSRYRAQSAKARSRRSQRCAVLRYAPSNPRLMLGMETAVARAPPSKNTLLVLFTSRPLRPDTLRQGTMGGPSVLRTETVGVSCRLGVALVISSPGLAVG